MTQTACSILTLTLNPSLDVSTRTDQVIPGPKLRCAKPRLDPGGGGINVSRAIRALGGESLALVARGGSTGLQLDHLLRAEGLRQLTFDTPGETRQSLAVTETATGQQFRFVLPGAAWTAAMVNAVMALTLKHAPDQGFVVISGSQPPGVPDDFPRHLAAGLAGRGQLVVDTSGTTLAALATAPVPGLSVLRMDSEEAEAIAKRPLPTRKESADFAESLVLRGIADCVIVARGADGSVLAETGQRLFCAAAKVPVKSKIGAGDSFVAAFVMARSEGADSAEALARGVAAASAAVMTEATALCRRIDAERLISKCPVTPI
ncbi:MAG: 1-phosphofructokinase family hexose kinase [Paracoccaceae bacterium]|nr:1-phosphofructokinase family hexose kinase [Paracoccaceae bacterium]